MKGVAAFRCALFAAFPAFAAKQYSYFRVGNPNDISATTTPGTVLMGGGTDVDAAFQWMCQRSGSGDFFGDSRDWH
jgi:cyanophycinase